MKKRRDQVRFTCPKCGLSKLLSHYEASAHMVDCGANYYVLKKRKLRKILAR